MSDDNKRGFFAQVFFALMLFCGLVWMWTVAFIIAWPWDKSSTWKPEFRLPAICADGQPCGKAFGELEEARSKGLIKSLAVPDAGEVLEDKNWLLWTTKNGLIEAKTSSWHFQTTIRYKVEADQPVLVEYQDVGVNALYFGIAGSLLCLLALYWRKLTGA